MPSAGMGSMPSGLDSRLHEANAALSSRDVRKCALCFKLLRRRRTSCRRQSTMRLRVCRRCAEPVRSLNTTAAAARHTTQLARRHRTWLFPSPFIASPPSASSAAPYAREELSSLDPRGRPTCSVPFRHQAATRHATAERSG